MTTYTADTHHGSIETVASVTGALELVIRTITTDGVPSDHTTIRDQWVSRQLDHGRPRDGRGLTGRLSTSALQVLGAKLVEHAEAVEQFRTSYRPAEWKIDDRPVEVFPGFPLTMTEREHVDTVPWPIGVRARDAEGDVWQRVAVGWRFVRPSSDTPSDDDSARLRNHLPATIIPTSWPTPAADTTPEN